MISNVFYELEERITAVGLHALFKLKLRRNQVGIEVEIAFS